jgi:hypothetical protein
MWMQLLRLKTFFLFDFRCLCNQTRFMNKNISSFFSWEEENELITLISFNHALQLFSMILKFIFQRKSLKKNIWVIVSFQTSSIHLNANIFKTLLNVKNMTICLKNNLLSITVRDGSQNMLSIITWQKGRGGVRKSKILEKWH